MVIQLAKHWGIKTINVIRRDDVKEELLKLGGDYVINSSTENIVERVKEITDGKLAGGALNPVAGIATKDMPASVKTGGKVFVYGLLGSKDSTVTVGIFDLGRAEIIFWTLFHVIDAQTLEGLAEKVSKLLEEKVLEPLAGKEYKLEEFKEAVVESGKAGGGGKVFLRL